MISATSSSITARYAAENQVAYQAGNAAKIVAPPTISQTSLPSQSGPTLPSATRRSASVAADGPVQHAHAEVEALEHEEPGPEEPDDHEPRPPRGSSVHLGRERRCRGGRSPDRRRRRTRPGGGSSGRLAKRSIRTAQTTPRARYRATKMLRLTATSVEADGGRVRVLGEQESLHDPRLATVLGEQPACRVHREQREEGEGADPAGTTSP